MSTLSDRIAKLCYQHFESLPKKGKPLLNKEWTLLAAIVMSTVPEDSNLKIVAMSTGTKCLGESQLSSVGDIISDSHAEVLTRRAFIRFLYHHMNLVLQRKKSEVLSFIEKSKKFHLNPGIKFHFFISCVPCGDAAIFPKAINDDGLDLNSDLEPKTKKFKKSDDIDSLNLENSYGCQSVDDIYRTGAKCVKEGLQDPKEPGKNYHVVGVLRTKPGRGIPTLSMSCSDKLALWCVCGLQGALLSNYLESPIYASSFVIGKCAFNAKAFERAVYERLSNIKNLPPTFCLKKPVILTSSLAFNYSQENVLKINNKAVPCPSSIIWSNVPDPLEVSVNGKKQGVTKKNFSKPSSRISICRQIFLENFLKITTQMSCYDNKLKYFLKEGVTYLECKKSAEAYQAAKEAVFKIFYSWVHKPISLQEFSLSLEENKNI